jgi:Succinylglutamate desuccinylase / Aspartoacylase family
MNRVAGPLTQYFAKPSSNQRLPVAPATSIASITPAAPAVRDYAALVARIKAAAGRPLSWRVYGQQASADGAERYDLLLVHIPARIASAPAGAAGAAAGPGPAGAPGARGTAGGYRHVLLNGGTHGEEPAGAEALVRFLEERRHERWPEVAFTVVPCANPWGYAHARRAGPGGRDLNRVFRRAGRATPEVALLKRALGRRACDLLVDCHEDEDAPGLYVFAPPALGQAVVAAAGALGPVHPGPLVDDVLPLAGGVVAIDAARAQERRRTWRNWPLPFFIAQVYQRAAARGGRHRARRRAEPAWTVVETPVHLPLDRRVAMHLAAIDAALAV